MINLKLQKNDMSHTMAGTLDLPLETISFADWDLLEWNAYRLDFAACLLLT